MLGTQAHEGVNGFAIALDLDTGADLWVNRPAVSAAALGVDSVGSL